MMENSEQNYDEYVPEGPATDEQMHHAFTALSYFVVASVVIAVYLGTRVPLSAEDQAAALALSAKTVTQGSIARVPAPSAYDNLALSARAAVVYDVITGETLYDLNSHDRLPLASLTKIMTALVAIEEFGPDHEVIVGTAALAAEGDEGLLAYDRLRAAPLASLTLVTSSNDGAEVLARAEDRDLFITRMNERAQELSLTQTSFFNPSGLDINERLSGGYGSAYDVARLLFAGVRASPETFAATIEPIFATGPYEVKNTNDRLHEIPGLIASKTGFTDLAGGNLAIMFDAGLARPVVVVVLGSTIDGRFDDAYALAQAARTDLAAANN